MAEVEDFFPVRQNRFRTTRFPGTVGGSIGPGGNFVPAPAVSNPNPTAGQNVATEPTGSSEGGLQGGLQGGLGRADGEVEPITPPPIAPRGRSGRGGQDEISLPASLPGLGGIRAPLSRPDLGSSAGELAKSAARGAVTSFGQGAGAAFAQGATGAEAASAGLNSASLGTLGSEFAPNASGFQASGLTPQAAAGPSPGGSGFGGRLTSKANLGGAGGAGVGRFAIGLLTGEDIGRAAAGGAASAAGFAIGNAIAPGIGGVIGSFALDKIVGSLFGDDKPNVGGAAILKPDASGRFEVADSGGKHVDMGPIIQAGRETSEGLNAFLDAAGLRAHTGRFPLGAGEAFDPERFGGRSGRDIFENIAQYPDRFLRNADGSLISQEQFEAFQKGGSPQAVARRLAGIETNTPLATRSELPPSPAQLARRQAEAARTTAQTNARAIQSGQASGGGRSGVTIQPGRGTIRQRTFNPFVQTALTPA